MVEETRNSDRRKVAQRVLLAAAALAAPTTAAAEPLRLPELRWRMPGVAVPMRYERTDVIGRIRALGALPPVPPDARACADELLARAPGSASADHARVAAALVLLGAGAADEAHNLATPLSWHYGTPFGGPPVENSPAAAEATYAHALIHRLEAHHVGEFGTGFHNSAFWFAHLSDLSDSSELSELGGGGERHERVFAGARRAALEAADAPEAREHRLIQRWLVESCQPDTPRAEAGDAGDAEEGLAVWSPVALNGLLAHATATPDHALRTFCETLATAELRLLLDHCLQACGMAAVPAGTADAAGPGGGGGGDGADGGGDGADGSGDGGGGRDEGGARVRMSALRAEGAVVGGAASTDAGDGAAGRPRQEAEAAAAGGEGELEPEAAFQIGLRAARRVSDAHAAAFAERGAVAVRGALAGLGDEAERRLAAAALAARLLGVPAVWALRGGADDPPPCASVLVAGGAPASAGTASGRADTGLPAADAIVFAGAPDDGRSAAAAPSAALALRFASAPPGRSPSAAAAWVDPLHGKRGRTPTSVVEWSKGPPAVGEVHRPPE